MVLGSLPSHVHIVGEAWSRKGYLGCACLEPADVVSGNASGEADKPALAEAAVARHDTVLPVPVPAEVEAADAVDTDVRLNHCRDNRDRSVLPDTFSICPTHKSESFQRLRSRRIRQQLRCRHLTHQPRPGRKSHAVLLKRLISWACDTSADLVHATQARCSEPSAAKETPADGFEQRQATAASSSVGTGKSIA